MSSSLHYSVREIKAHQGLTVSERQDLAHLVKTGLPVEAALAGPVAYEFQFSIGDDRVLMQGAAQGAWKLPCSRCAKDFELPFEETLEEVYGPSVTEIDGGEELRQALALSLPTKPLCKDDCAGLCVKCGSDLNQGPCACVDEKPSPFAKLKQLKD